MPIANENSDDPCLGGRRDTLNRRGLCQLLLRAAFHSSKMLYYLSWYYLVHFLLHLGIRCRRDLNAFVVACFLPLSSQDRCCLSHELTCVRSVAAYDVKRCSGNTIATAVMSLVARR